MKPPPSMPPRLPAAVALVAVLHLASGGCAAPEPAPSAFGGGDWTDKLIDAAGQVTLAAESGALFYAVDALALPGKEVGLTAKVTSVKNMKGIKDVTVAFLRGKDALGQVKTDEDGNAVLSWKPPAAGDYDITAKVAAVADEQWQELVKLPAAPLRVAVRPRETRFVVIDLDHTVVASSFFRVLIGGAKPMPDAAKVIKELQKKYSIVYLTHRPDLLTAKSKGWLAESGFPRAPLLVSTLKQAVGDSGEFKTARLKSLRETFPGVALGIGDKFSDAQAYVDNGLDAYLIPHYDRDTDDPKDLREVAEKVRKLDKKIHVVDNWQEVRAGIFQGRKFPPGPYADRLEARARKLLAERDRRKSAKRRRKGDDDDDDDDEDDD